MGLQTFLDSNPNLDLSNPFAVDQAFEQSLKASEIVQSQQAAADPIVEEEGQPLEQPTEVAQADPAVDAAAAPAGETPPAVAEPTEVEQMRAELAAAKAKLTEYETKQQTEAAQAAAAEAAKAGQEILNELIETYGEDSPIVKAHKFQMARETPKPAPAAAVDPANDPQAPAKHAAALEQTPFLRSIFDGADPEMLAFADIVSDKIMRDSAGTPDAVPVSKEHYLAVEKRLLERFPQAKAQFYPTRVQRDDLKNRNNVTTLRDLSGGSAPPTGTARQIGMKEVMAVMHEPQYKGMDIDQILASLVRAA